MCCCWLRKSGIPGSGLPGFSGGEEYRMNFFRKLESRFGKYAIPNLMYYIILLYGAGILLSFINPSFYYQVLSLNPQAILHGQVWRLVTFLICPPSSGLFFNLIAMYLYYSLGSTLERTWGTFRFNVYFIMGILGHILAAFLIYLLFGYNYLLTTYFLNESLFLAFAATFPEVSFLLFWVFPVKAKWFGLVIGLQFLYEFAVGGAAARVAIAVSMLNFIIFFLMTRDAARFSPREAARRREFRTEVKKAEKARMRPVHHRCAVCGRTEEDHPELEFRYCSKCVGALEYCTDHLYTHVHVTEEERN